MKKIQNKTIFLRNNYLIFFSMLFMSIMLCNTLLANRYVSLSKDTFVLGAAFISPLFFILSDIIAEIFGYKIAKQMIWYSFICQLFFSILFGLVMHAPYPDFFTQQPAYAFFSSQLLYIILSSFIAFIISGLINVRIVTRWKILLRGKYFWLRSLGASTIAHGIYSALAILLISLGSMSMLNLGKVILFTYLIKITYSIAFAAPSNMLVNYIKRNTKIVTDDFPAKRNPFKQIDQN